MKGNDMSHEESLVFLLGRLHFDDFTKMRIYHLIKSGIDWYKFLNVCVKRRLICLIYKNLINLELIQLLPLIIVNNMKYHYKNNFEHNTVLIQTVNTINSYFKQNNILAVPVKGLHFLHTIYKEDIGVRILSDIDYIASSKKKDDIHSFMQKSGYQTYLINNQDAFCLIDSDIQSYFYIKFESNNCYDKLRIDFDFNYPDFWVEEVMSSDNHIYIFMYLCKAYCMSIYGKTEPYTLPQYNYEKLIDIHEYYKEYLTFLDTKRISSIANDLHIKNEVSHTINCLKNLYTDMTK